MNNEQEIERLNILNEELTNELMESRKKENELLQFTKSATEKNVALQSKFSSLEAMVNENEINLIKKVIYSNYCDYLGIRSLC